MELGALASVYRKINTSYILKQAERSNVAFIYNKNMFAYSCSCIS